MSEALPQCSQKCPICLDSLLSGQETTTYSGHDPLYQGWIAHKECNDAFEEIEVIDVIRDDEIDEQEIDERK